MESKSLFEDRLQHSLNGPAVVYNDGKREYWAHGIEVSEEEWKEIKDILPEISYYSSLDKYLYKTNNYKFYFGLGNDNKPCAQFYKDGLIYQLRNIYPDEWMQRKINYHMYRWIVDQLKTTPHNIIKNLNIKTWSFLNPVNYVHIHQYSDDSWFVMWFAPNNSAMPHNENGPALINSKDGVEAGEYYLWGMHLPKKVWKRIVGTPKDFTFEVSDAIYYKWGNGEDKINLTIYEDYLTLSYCEKGDDGNFIYKKFTSAYNKFSPNAPIFYTQDPLGKIDKWNVSNNLIKTKETEPKKEEGSGFWWALAGATLGLGLLANKKEQTRLDEQEKVILEVEEIKNEKH